MTTDPHSDPQLWSARRERARRWLHTGLKGYPVLHCANGERRDTLSAVE